MKPFQYTTKICFHKVFWVFSILFIFICSCTKNKNAQELVSHSDLEDYYEFQGFNLSKNGIPATIMLPDETANIGASTTPEVAHLESDFYWNIYVGQNFHLHIEDFGDNTNLVQDHKQKIENTPFYEVNYLLDEKDLIVYEIKLKVRGHAKASKSVGVEHISYHVYGEKVIDGIHYELRSRDEGFSQQIIELMAKSIRSFKDISK